MKQKWIALSRSRRLVCDFLYFAAGVPTVPIHRRMSLASVVEARNAFESRPSWTAIFTKAYAIVAEEFPELRRAYLKLPWPHLIEYSRSIAFIASEREFEGEKTITFSRIKDPGKMPLAIVSRTIRGNSVAPVEQLKDFRRGLRLARLPRPLRLIVWWVGLNWGRKRLRYFGTFGVSVYSALGAESLHPLSPFTTLLNYGIISSDGSVDVRIVYDHRVLDGAVVARALQRMEVVLNSAIVDEIYQEAQPTNRLSSIPV